MVSLSSGEYERVIFGQNDERGPYFIYVNSGRVRLARSRQTARNGRIMKEGMNGEVEMQGNEDLWLYAEEDSEVTLDKQGFSLSLFEREYNYTIIENAELNLPIDFAAQSGTLTEANSGDIKTETQNVKTETQSIKTHTQNTYQKQLRHLEAIGIKTMIYYNGSDNGSTMYTVPAGSEFYMVSWAAFNNQGGKADLDIRDETDNNVFEIGEYTNKSTIAQSFTPPLIIPENYEIYQNNNGTDNVNMSVWGYEI